MSTSFQEKLIWLKGKKVAVCEPDESRFNEMKLFLEHYGLEVIVFRNAEAMHKDLEQRQYATQRVFFAVFLNYELAKELEQTWRKVINANPKLAKTPMILMLDESQLEDRVFIESELFRFNLTYPIAAPKLLRVLRWLNRWKAIAGNTSPAATTSHD